MILPIFDATQVRFNRIGDRWECSILTASQWLYMGIGDTFEAAMANAMRRPAIAMGRDAPELADVSRLDFDGPGAA